MIINDDVPLRGVLRCECGRLLTAGKSKGKSKYYWYYKCQSHLNVNINAAFVHYRFNELLSQMSFALEHQTMLQLEIEKAIKKGLAERQTEIPSLKSKLLELNKNVHSLEEKFIKNEIGHEAFYHWSKKYSEEKLDAENKLEKYSQVEADIIKKSRKRAVMLDNIEAIFAFLNTCDKQRLVNILFNHGLHYKLNYFISSYISPSLSHNQVSLKDKGLLLVTTPYLRFGQAEYSAECLPYKKQENKN